jgi:hypothetical protein
MALDEPVGDLHDLDQIHLLPVGRIARVFEDHRSRAVGEIAGAVVGPQWGLAGGDPLEHGP